MMDTVTRHNDDVQVLGEDDVPNEIRALCEGKPHWVTADLFRLWLLREHGGTWLDTDCICLRRVDLSSIVDAEVIGWGDTRPNHFSNNVLYAGERIQDHR